MVDVSESHWGHIDTFRDTMLGLRNPWDTWGDSMICLGHSAKLLDVAWERPQLWSPRGLVPFKTLRNIFYGFCLGRLFVRVFQQLFHQKKKGVAYKPCHLVILATIGPSYVTDGTGAGSRAFSSASAENPLMQPLSQSMVYTSLNLKIILGEKKRNKTRHCSPKRLGKPQAPGFPGASLPSLCELSLQQPGDY